MTEDDDIGDDVWDHAVDRAIILMSLTLTRHMIGRAKWSKRMVSSIVVRLDRLIQEYKKPIAHDEQWRDGADGD